MPSSSWTISKLQHSHLKMHITSSMCSDSRAAASVIASDGNGAYTLCSLVISRQAPGGSRSTRARVILDSTGLTGIVPTPTHAVCVGFALHKADRPEWAVQKLTELGVDRIVLFTTARTVVRLDRADRTRRTDRLRRIARQAGAQSRVLRLPTIEGPMSYDEALTSAPTPLAVAEPGAPPIAAPLATILVGPEGGSSKTSSAGRRGSSGSPIRSFGTETAAITAGVLLSELRFGAGHGPSTTLRGEVT